MYYKTFVKLGFTDSNLLPTNYPLFDFNANPEYPLGKITLPVRIGIGSVNIEFLVVKLPSPYNLILGRTWLQIMQAVPSTYHQLLCFPTEYGIKQILGSQKSAQACYRIAAAKRPKELEVNSIEILDRESLEDIGKIPSEKAIEDLDRIEINESPNQFFIIGTSLNEVDRHDLVSFLLGNLDQFKLGDGKRIKFWLDVWASCTPLSNLYPRLFSLATNKDSFVHQYLHSAVDNQTHWNITYRRSLRVWEDELLLELISRLPQPLSRLLQPLNFSNNCEDTLLWVPIPSGSFTVKSLYEIFEINPLSNYEDVEI